jgi:hypothetical protein
MLRVGYMYSNDTALLALAAVGWRGRGLGGFRGQALGLPPAGSDAEKDVGEGVEQAVLHEEEQE